MDINQDDIDKVKQLYPGLAFVQKGKMPFLEGMLEFACLYDKKTEQLAIDPLKRPIPDEAFIADSYRVEISLADDFPTVRETGGRIQQIADKYGITDFRTLHINKDQRNAACLCPTPAQKIRCPDKTAILDFINNLVVPFFYGLSYFDRYKQWPWSEYGHGDVGIFEFYHEEREKRDLATAKNCFKVLENKGKKLVEDQSVKGHHPCLCGSGRKFRDCHRNALEGIWDLKEILKGRV